MATYLELLKNRRSIRDYQDKKVSRKIIDEILLDTCMAPSASNTQPWRFIVIDDKNLMQRISDESKKNLLAEIAANPNSSHKRYKRMLQEGGNVFYNAPCLILIVGQNNYKHFEGDCALAAAYLMFAAVERGVGTCWVGLGAYINDETLRSELKLPKDYEIAASIIVGFPTEIPETVLRKAPIILNN